MSIEIKLDSVGGKEDASYEIIEIYVKEGDYIRVNDVLMVVEGDKATIEITSEYEGVIKQLSIALGQIISEGESYIHIEPVSNVVSDEPRMLDEKTSKYDLAVIGAGPGGYTAAFRAADLGMKVALIERYSSLGGVCLNVGCIPSKSLLHIAKIINEAEEVHQFGVEFSKPQLNIEKIRKWKDRTLSELTDGVTELARLRKVDVFHGTAEFLNSKQLLITEHGSPHQESTLDFEHAIIAAGSRANKISHLPDDPRIIDSANALSLEHIPDRLLIIGAGIIGLEMAAVYDALGSKVTVAAKYDQLIPECDGDIVKPLYDRIAERYNVYLETMVSKVVADDAELTVHFEGNSEVPTVQAFDSILVSIGRHPNGHVLSADLAGVYVDEAGYIPVDSYQRTNVNNIFAIGDIAGKPMLAHKAIHEGKVAAEVIAGLHSRFDATVVPSVAYTDPEVSWIGLTEKQARSRGVKYGIGVFPWSASGRALSLGRGEGKTKILFDLVTDQILGAGIVGAHAGDLIAEIGLAIENNIKAHAISSTIHPHPTLSETVAFATEVFESTITDLYLGTSLALNR